MLNLKEKWFEILVTIVIFGGFALLFTQNFNLKGDMGELKGNVIEHGRRIDRIASALPDLKIRIAHEEIYKPFSSAVIIAKPIELNQGEIASAIHILNHKNGDRKTYIIKSNSLSADELSCILAGRLFNADPNAISFYRLEQLSYNTNNIIFISSDIIDKNNSVILNDSADKFEREIVKMVNSNKIINISKNPISCKISPELFVWKVLANDINKNPQYYELTKSKNGVICPTPVKE